MASTAKSMGEQLSAAEAQKRKEQETIAALVDSPQSVLANLPDGFLVNRVCFQVLALSDDDVDEVCRVNREEALRAVPLRTPLEPQEIKDRLLFLKIHSLLALGADRIKAELVSNDLGSDALASIYFDLLKISRAQIEMYRDAGNEKVDKSAAGERSSARQEAFDFLLRASDHAYNNPKKKKAPEGSSDNDNDTAMPIVDKEAMEREQRAKEAEDARLREEARIQQAREEAERQRAQQEAILRQQQLAAEQARERQRAAAAAETARVAAVLKAGKEAGFYV